MDAGFSAHQVAPGRDGLLRDRPDAPVWQPLFGYRRRAACRRHPHVMAAHDGKLQLLLAGIGNGTGRFLRDAVRIPESDPPFQKQAQTGPHGVGAGLHDDEVTFGDGLEFVRSHEGCAILVDEEFSCLEFDMNRDTISWIRRKIEYRRSLMELSLIHI